MRRRTSRGAVLAFVILAIVVLAGSRQVPAFSPKSGDFFHYNESIVVNNGKGSYDGYTDSTQVVGQEQMQSVSNATVSASYSYSSQFSNSQGAFNSTTKEGLFTWSSATFTYLKGTDNQVGYVKPVYVWFAMDRLLPTGSHFHLLNTPFVVQSRNFSFQLPSANHTYVQTVHAQGTGNYERNDDYGQFSASYTWDAYFDPSTGYIVGYTYVEQDNGAYQGQSGSFTLTDTLYLTSSSYTLAHASPPNTSLSASVQGMLPFLILALLLLVVVLVIVAVLVARSRKRRTLPPHSQVTGVPPPSSAPWGSTVDLGAKPTEQVVIREVAKVRCAYCGTLIPTTVDTCPYCGGPRR